MEWFWDSLKDDPQEEEGRELVELGHCSLLAALRRLAPDPEVPEEDAIFGSVLNRYSQISEDQLENEMYVAAVEYELQRHGLEDWAKGRTGYLVSGQWVEEACSADHVKEEDRMDSRLPLTGLPHTAYLDRARTPELAYLVSRQLGTLLFLLRSHDDFLRIQALCGLREWMITGSLKPFEAHPEVMFTLANVMFHTKIPAIKRMAAKILAGLAKSYSLRNQFLTEEGKEVIYKFLAILTKQDNSCQGELTRGLIANFFSNATDNDLNFTGYILKNFNLDLLFHCVDTSYHWFLKMNVLQFMKNILMHPSGYEVLTEVSDLDLSLLMRALLSISPVFHQISFEILNILLRVSRNPWQDRMHTLFIQCKGIYYLASLLEETCFLDTQTALNTLLLMNHLADGKKAMHVLILSVINLLKSILYHNNETKELSFAKKTKTQEKFLPNAINDSIKESLDLDKYNSINAVPVTGFDLKLNYEFLDDSDMKVRKSKTPGQLSEKFSKRVFQNLEKEVEIKPRDSPLLALCDRRIEWRHAHDWTCSYHAPEISELARACIETPTEDVQYKIDVSLKIMAMEILAKLSRHKNGARLLCDMIRCVYPALERYRETPRVCESAAFCLQQLIENTFAQLGDLLPQNNLLRELVGALGLQADTARASVLGALAALLKQSPTSVHSFPNFRIRAPLHLWLQMTPEEAPPDASLYNLVILYCTSRIYIRRDYVMSRTLVSNLFRIIQDSRTEDISKIYAICSLAFLTFSNKRYRKPAQSHSDPDKEHFQSRSFSDLTGLGYESSEDVSEMDESGPYPTRNSFTGIELDEQLFLQTESRGTRSPVTFFNLFFLKLLLERSPSFWTSFIFQYYYTLMGWLNACLEQNIPMAQELYETIMHNIPTLSFYNNDIVHPWSRIDKDEFIVCVEKGKDKNSFPMLLSCRDELDSIYYRYILSEKEVISPTPWDIYWKDCYDSQANHSTPRSISSAMPDSLFGLGGMLTERSEEDMVIQVYSKEMENLKPQITEKYFLYYPESSSFIKRCKLTSTFNRSRKASAYANNKYFNINDIITPKPIILPTLYRYMQQLLQNIPLCKSRKYEKTIYSFNKCFAIKKKRKDNYENICLLRLKEFYKPRIKMFSKEQFKLLVKALKNPPLLWRKLCDDAENAGEDSPQVQKQLNALRLLLKPFPNKFLKTVSLPTFNREMKLRIPSFKISPYEEAANVVSTLILDSYENLIDKTLDIRKPELKRANKKMSDDIVWVDDGRLPDHLFTQFTWVRYLSTAGRLWISALDRPLNPRAGRYLVQYKLPPETGRPSGGSTLQRKSRRSSASLTCASERPSRRPDPSEPDSEWLSTVLSSTTEADTGASSPRRDGDRRKPSGVGAVSPPAGRLCSALSRGDLCLPTFSEIILDLFFQSHNVEFRKFRYMSQSEMIFGPHEKLSDSKNSIDLRAGKYILESNLLSLRRKIDYQNVNSMSQTNQGNSSQDVSTRPERNPSFPEYCIFVKTGVLNILLNKDVQCWYSDIIKFIARSVCLRLEGPFGYVDEYIMRHHRQELRRLLGTTLIPFGRLRIGGPLERAILFKFFADQFMIPCGLQREGMSRAWVEVPSHPFLYPLRGTSIVNLENSPGKLIDANSPEADEYKGYKVNPKVNKFITENDSNSTGYYLQDSFEKVILDVKAKELSILERLKASILECGNTVIANDSDSSECKKSFESLGKHGESTVSKKPECSFILSKDHFKEKDSNEFSESEEVEILTLPTDGNEEISDNVKTRQMSILNITANEEIVKFSWREDPDGRYTTVIGKIPNNAFCGGTFSVYRDTVASVEPIAEWQYKKTDNSFPGISYIPSTTENMMNELMAGNKITNLNEPQTIPQQRAATLEFETEEYFKDWETLLKKLSPPVEPHKHSYNSVNGSYNSVGGSNNSSDEK